MASTSDANIKDMRFCEVCKGSESSQMRWLLTCRQCQRSYHHNDSNCYTPKITHAELQIFVKKPEVNGIISWLCSSCHLEKRTRASGLLSRAGSASLPSSDSEGQKKKIRRTKEKKLEVIDLLSPVENDELVPVVKGREPKVQDSRVQAAPSAIETNIHLRPAPSMRKSRTSSGIGRAPTEEVVLVDPYTNRSKSTNPTGPAHSLSYRERQPSLQSITTDELSRQLSALSVPSRAASCAPEESGGSGNATGPPSSNASPAESPTVEDPPGFYTFQLPGERRSSGIRLDLGATKTTTKVVMLEEQGARDEIDLIHNFGEFKLMADKGTIKQSKRRRSRKVRSVKLNNYHKTLGQKAFSFNIDTWLKERNEERLEKS